MAAAEEQQQHPQDVSSNDENAVHVANQIALKLEQKRLGNELENVCEKEHTNITAKEAATELGRGPQDTVKQQLRVEGSFTSIGEDLESVGGEKSPESKKTSLVVEDDAPMPKELLEMENGAGTVTDEDGAMEVDDVETGEDSTVEMKEVVTSLAVKEVQSTVVADTATEIDDDTLVENNSVPMEVDSGEKETSMEFTEDVIKITVEKLVKKTITALQGGDSEPNAVEAVTEVTMTYTSHTDMAANLNEAIDKKLRENNDEKALRGDAEVEEAVGQIVHTLVDNVVEFMNETLSSDTDSVKMLSSPMIPYLSADEAMELLEAHQGDDHELTLDQDDGADADVEAEPIRKSEYQWFDGDDDDEEGVALASPSALDDVDTTDDVFGFSDVVDLTDVAYKTGENAALESDESGETLVIRSRSSSPSLRSARSSSSSSGSSSSSSSSASSASEDEQVSRVLKKRQASKSGQRKVLRYKKQKRVRSSMPQDSSQRRYKRKRKIPMPVIPKEFEVFDSAASDPILKGSYSVRNNRRACFVGNWGFSDEAFHNGSVSPFEYTSRARVVQSRRKDDKRPISGKYGGFFKFRQFNGTLVKIREDQVDLQFLPMPPSDEEDGDEEMEVYASDEDGDESAASRYTVLGKGKNRFGRFLIRGYLDPESGRLVVKRRYLE